MDFKVSKSDNELIFAGNQNTWLNSDEIQDAIMDAHDEPDYLPTFIRKQYKYLMDIVHIIHFSSIDLISQLSYLTY